MTFDPLWRTIQKRCQEKAIPLVQEYKELHHVYELMKGSNSYLEIGSAEGNSLYILAHALNHGSRIVSVNIDDHTKILRQEVIKKLSEHWPVFQKNGDSADRRTIVDVCGSYDCVLIDGGHDRLTVLSDAFHYAFLAKRYVFFHDIQLPEVKEVIDFFVKHWKIGTFSTFVNSEHYGYGIIEVTK